MSSLRDVLFSHKQETKVGVFSCVFMVPSGYKLDRDIAAMLSNYKEFGSQIACPKFTTTTKHKMYIKTLQIQNDLSTVLVELNHDMVLLLLCRVNSEQFSTGR